jgi:predicted PurR-regulated permease PerM
VTRPRATDGRFVIVWVENPYRVATTDEEGRYELTDLEPGEYKVQARYGDLVQTFPQRVEVRAGHRTIPVDLELSARSPLNLTGVVTWIAERLKAFLLGLINSLSGLISFFLLLPITTFYFLRDYDPLRRRLFALVPEGNRTVVADLAGQINRILGGYLRGLFIVCGLVGLETTVMLFIWSLVFGSKYWLLLGLLTGLFSVIPYIGMPTAAILTAITCYLTSGWGAAIASLVSISVINFVSDSVVSPKIIGKQVGLHPLLMIFALMAGGSLFGVVGMILASPVAASIKAIVVHFWPALTSPLPPEIAPPAPPPRRWRWPRRRTPPTAEEEAEEEETAGET